MPSLCEVAQFQAGLGPARPAAVRSFALRRCPTARLRRWSGGWLRAQGETAPPRAEVAAPGGSVRLPQAQSAKMLAFLAD